MECSLLGVGGASYLVEGISEEPCWFMISELIRAHRVCRGYIGTIYGLHRVVGLGASSKSHSGSHLNAVFTG